MKRRPLAQRYARVLYDLGRESSELDRLAADLARVLDVFGEHPELRQRFESLAVPARDKQQLIESVFGDRVHLWVGNLLRLLVRRRRENLLPDIVAEFTALRDREAGVLEAEVEAAAELHAATRQRLEEELARSLGARQVRLAVRVRPELLGGLVVKIGDRRLDASLRRRLVQLHRRLATGGQA
ncbi:ATP synthase F1 subunit delta [Thermaerobacter sp. PB12/4term]|uniref:ATP synthase F1 subunit delta n=1 Tax=Thermaerobacter sp. PB12/4term TaxID=2293838 RepID=UPI000E32A721|nr:ATP synthase F1 subunit delta [Thermaerobacter sp. PB12/4term]QIA26229.1 ATP synthase F1 subunit delta [Thermaerobacter sp. PB12/4term]